MLNKLSFNLMNELNESETETYKIKKKVFMESDKVTIKEAHSKNENRKTIWSSEIDTSREAYEENLQANGYDSEEEAVNDGYPSYEDWAYGDLDNENDIIVEDLEDMILPSIENQMNFDMLFLTGDYHSNYGDFRPSGNGGTSLHGIDELKDYIFRWDGVEISNEDGNVVLDAGDHDGSIEVGLYTFIDDKNKILEDLGYYADSKKYAEDDPEFDWESDAETEFENDLYYGGIDWNTIKDHTDLLKPIKDTISGLGEACETKINESSYSKTALEDIANDIIKFYDTDMGTHFDEIKGNEDEVWNETIAILDNPQDNKETIEGFIADLTSTMEETSEEEISKLFGINANKLIKELNDVLDGEYEPVEDVNPKDFKLNVVEESIEDDTKKYKVTSYYGLNYSGVEDTLETDDLQEVEEWIWEKCQKGGMIELVNTETGDIKRYSAEKFDENTMDITDLEENQIEDAKADSIEKGLYSEGDKKVCENCGKEPCECKSNLNEDKGLTEAEELAVKNLQIVKEQGNIYMLEDENKQIIVGENYNAEEGLIENAEIYKAKNEADEDYLSRCDITKDGKEFNPESKE